MRTKKPAKKNKNSHARKRKPTETVSLLKNKAKQAAKAEGQSGKATQSKKRKGKKKGDLHPRVLISGYYGFDNLGDELILRVLVDELKARDVKITVLRSEERRVGTEC